MIQQQQESKITTTKYRWIKAGLQILIIILLVTVTVIPGALRLLYRADAQVALGHAKSVRLALQVTGKESYGRNDTFTDASQEGGVTESVRKEVLMLSKAPGDFWVLQMSDDGYTVDKFLYCEGEYTVWYTRSPESYTVYRREQMTGSEIQEQETKE